MEVEYRQEALTAAQFSDLLHRSGLAARRSADDLARLQRMLDNSSLIVTARLRATGELIGVARSLTDWSYATYLSELAVDAAFKGQGIGSRLIEETRILAGPETMLLLVSAPDAVGFYQKIDMPPCDRAFLYPRER